MTLIGRPAVGNQNDWRVGIPGRAGDDESVMADLIGHPCHPEACPELAEGRTEESPRTDKSSQPIALMVEKISSNLFSEGFFVPEMYCAKRLWEMPMRRATADAFSSGCDMNNS